jgi:hypothetical protein
VSNQEELLARLHDIGLRLWVEDGRLRYSAPSGMVTAETLSDLRMHKPELIELLSGKPVPATPGQHALWFLTQVSGLPASAAYTMPHLLRLRGPVDIEALSRSLRSVLDRHQILRSTVRELDGTPMLVVGRPVVSLRRSDLSRLPRETRQRALRDELEAESQRPFVLETGPLVRGRLIRLGRTDWMFSLIVHHIVFDEWSSAILFRELDQFYSAYTVRSAEPPADKPPQFLEYVHWQQAYLQSRELERTLSYWRAQLEGYHWTLELPTGSPRSGPQSYAGSSYCRPLPDDVYDKLNNIARDRGTTVFVVMFTLFALLLSLRSGQADVCIGTPMANRMKPEFEAMIGMFVNMVPLRIDLSGDPSFLTAVSRARKVCIEAIDNQALPFATLIQELRPPPTAARNPLFQAAFVMPAAHSGPPQLGALDVETCLPPSRHAKFDLTMEIGRSRGRHTVTLEYSTELFREETIACMASDFCELADQAASKPGSRPCSPRA